MFTSMFSCNEEPSFIQRDFSKVEFETVLEDSTLSIRAIDILNDGSLAFAANNNRFGLLNEMGVKRPSYRREDRPICGKCFSTIEVESQAT